MPDALILCGGNGARLRPALPGIPKSLAPVRGRPFLECLLLQLAGWGVPRAVLCTGVGGDQIAGFARGRHWPLEVVISQEPAPLGTGGALSRGLAQARGEVVMAVNGDSMAIGLDGGAFWRFQQRHAAQPAMVLTTGDGRTDTGSVRLGRRGRVAAFLEKAPARGARHQNAGMYLLPRALLEAVPAQRNCSLEHALVPLWLASGIWGFVHEGRLLDIGTPERWRAAEVELTNS